MIKLGLNRIVGGGGVYPQLSSYAAKKSGFTLAEVLITLGIIGIVAALTIPSLVNNYQERVTVTKLKKVYSVLLTAFNQAIAENGTVNLWSDAETKPERAIDYNKVMKNYLKYSHYCAHGNNLGICNNTGIWYGLSQYFTSASDRYFLPDGSIIEIRQSGPDGSIMCEKPTYYNSSPVARYYQTCGNIVVDLNNKNGPNRAGIDMFMFKIYQNNISPVGTRYDHSVDGFGQCAKYSGSVECTAWVIENENMDYKRCPEKLGWDKAKSCKK